MSIYWFAILLIVAVAIVYMVSSFYGESYDIREMEADALVYQVSNCLIPNLYLEESYFTSEDFLSSCKITLNVEDYGTWKNEEQFFVSVLVSDFLDGSVIFSSQEGNVNLNDFCSLQKSGHEKKLPYCLDRKIYSVSESGKQYFVNVHVVIDKGEKNAKL